MLTFFKAVILQNEQFIAWHKTPTTPDIQAGIELAIEEVIRKGQVAPASIKSVKIGTTVSKWAIIPNVFSGRSLCS
jgi:N-methylhydantoinase A/oxoprolinase/acetone carboxylase beta subunit